jgi:large subunit ribosomal protein L15
MNLSNLKPRPKSKHRVKRLGCGESSGHGKTSGKGHKGQKARSGGSIRLGFEGGQMPLMRRIPKRGFNQTMFRDAVSVVGLGDLQSLGDVEVTPKALAAAGLIRNERSKVKILCNGSLSRLVSVSGCAVSESAKAVILGLGGRVE